ncbi:TetR/AcrR family transcriptional regulator [Streptomyces blattellae]|uniref:TetR/AcrR family transcriptional regulator n=1 Tax=Streptomyces blattellae TaxID=2569855 RepID=UPI0012B72A08|nr:TetR/AcrR family transcriptional regulator [Streptomyces blattellae]
MPRTSDDPRIRRSRAAALAAAAQLLAEGGPARVTHAAVAQRAGVGRATVYRHWPDQQTLLLDTLDHGVRPMAPLGEGPVRDQLVTQLQQQADWLNRPGSASVIATVIERAERDENAQRIREAVFGQADQRITDALTAAVQRGELRPGVQEHAKELVSRIIGPLFFRRSMLGEQLEKDTVAGTVDTALRPWLPNA